MTIKGWCVQLDALQVSINMIWFIMPLVLLERTMLFFMFMIVRPMQRLWHALIWETCYLCASL